jgi:hypothetical protein
VAQHWRVTGSGINRTWRFVVPFERDDVIAPTLQTMTAFTHRTRRIAVIAVLAVTSGIAAPAAIDAAGGQVLSPTSAVIINACQHSSSLSRNTVPATAQLQVVRPNLDGEPRDVSSSPDLALFSRARTLYDCLVVGDHSSGLSINDGARAFTTHLTGSDPMAGISGYLKGGYTTLRDRDTLTVWATGVVSAKTTGVTLAVYYSVACPNDPVCPGPLISAGSSTAVLHGRFFAASMVVTFSGAHANFAVQLERRTSSGFSHTSTDAENFLAPASSRPVFSTFNVTN